jgi:hypothetical protein
MSQALALITQDAALVRCELDRVRVGLPFEPSGVVGVGGWQDGHVVQRRYGVDRPAAVASRLLGVGQSAENSSQPFRFRQWLFAAVGTLEKAEAVRERLWEELPEFLQIAVRGPTWEEAAFARFLAELRDIGRMEDAQLDAATAAARLGACARAVDQVSGGVGVTGKPGFALVASNGKIVVATRRGAQPLSYALLEGRAECARHQLPADARDGESLVRDHRRRRSVVVAAVNAEGWVPLPDGATIGIDRRLTATIK